MGHCPIVVYVRRTHDGTLACGIVQPVTGQVADMPTRGLDDSRTSQLAGWTSRGLDNSWMPPATLRALLLSCHFFGHLLMFSCACT